MYDINNVIKFVKRGDLLRPGLKRPLRFPVFEINSLDNIEVFQYRPWEADRSDADRATTDEDEAPYAWIDIKKIGLSEYCDEEGRVFPNGMEFALAMEAKENELRPIIRASLAGRMPEHHIAEYLDEITEDIGMILRFRTLMGPRPHMVNTIWEVYQSGGFACGWRGKYPDGRMVVYYPPAQPVV